MRYRIKGAIKDTGEEVEIDVTATSDNEAMAVASKLSLLAESVEAIIQPKAKTVAACHACGVVIESQGVLRVIDDQCFCRECFGKRLVVSDNNPTPLTEQELQSLGVTLAYDKFNDVTTVTASALRSDDSEVPEKLESTPNTFIDMVKRFGRGKWRDFEVRALFPGRVQVAPICDVRISLRFRRCPGDPPLFPKRLQTDLILLLDGKRVSVTIDEWLKGKDLDMICYEVNFTVKQPLLSDLHLAGEIHGRLVTETMDLTKCMHSALNALARVVKFQDVVSPR